LDNFISGEPGDKVVCSEPTNGNSVCRSDFDIGPTTIRAAVSEGPPGGKGEMRVLKILGAP
jgi:hypothetical protein